jgi:tetratricopeptide (TPR) repeat protein
MAKTVAPERKHRCPEEHKWADLAAGLCSAAEATPLLTHASDCIDCGHRLREATEDFNPEVSAKEQELIEQLPSTRAAWQREVAHKMAEISGATWTTTIAGGREIRHHAAWSSSAWMRWAGPAAAAALLAVAGALWIKRSPSLSSTNQLIAKAYTAQRPVELRFPGASYGPLRQERGEIDPRRSKMNEPPELLEAETQIARGLARLPQDAGWLQAKARADLFEGQYDSAINALHQAQVIRPDDPSLELDLATAYFERAEANLGSADHDADYTLALKSLDEVLTNNPNDLAALFNRAIVHEQLKKVSEAIADWQRYLRIDPAGEWAQEAKRRMEKLMPGSTTK